MELKPLPRGKKYKKKIRKKKKKKKLETSIGYEVGYADSSIFNNEERTIRLSDPMVSPFANAKKRIENLGITENELENDESLINITGASMKPFIDDGEPHYSK